MSLAPLSRSLLASGVVRFKVALLLLVLIGCSAEPPALLQPAEVSDPRTVEEVQPPTLPVTPVTDPLPALSGSVPLEPSFRAQATPSGRLEMRLLLISPTADNPSLEALTALCDQLGVPCDTLVAAKEALDPERLVAPNGDARYQGVFLTDNQLAFERAPGVWESAFSADEWNVLWDFGRDHGVRQVSLYTFPGTFPEDYGVRVAGYKSTDETPYPASLTAAGRTVFSSLKPGAQVPIRYAYTYQASLEPGTGVSAQPLLTDAAGNVLGVTSTSVDGRERLALTMAHNPYLLHTQLLGYDLVRWVTKGVFIGERSFYYGMDQDDWFAPTDRWDAAAGGVSGEYRMTARDVVGVVEQQRKLRRDYPAAKNFAFTMAFNGAYADLKARRDCNVATKSPDPLTSLTLCHKNEFLWINHTLTHAYMDAPTSYAEALSEVGQNTLLALKLGLVDRDYPLQSLVTGDVSGLGWFAPNGPDTGPKVDFGLRASNPEFLRALRTLRVRYLASNMSVRSHEPDCWGCGIPHPLEPSVFLVPRWPTNLFATPTTPEDMMHAYNAVYGPGGSDPFFGRNLTYDEYLDVESDIALYHLITGSPYQHYQHVGNLREYAPGRSLAYDWTDRLLEKYSRYYSAPIQTLNWDALGRVVADRTSFRRSGVTGVWDRTKGQVSLTSPRGGAAFVTGTGGKLKTALAAGQTRTFSLR